MRCIKYRGSFQKLKEAVAGISFFLFFVHERHAGLFRQNFQGPFKIQALYLLNEGKNVPAHIASETMVRTALGRNEKRRRALVVERAPRAQSPARAFQLHILRNHIGNGEFILDLLYGVRHSPYYASFRIEKKKVTIGL